MSNKQIIHAMAKRYVDRKFGLCVGNSAMRKGIAGGAIISYAQNWLAQHGTLPEGLHKVTVQEKTTGHMRWGGGSTYEVDFTRLMHEPDYPEPYVYRHNHVSGSAPVSENT